MERLTRSTTRHPVGYQPLAICTRTWRTTRSLRLQEPLLRQPSRFPSQLVRAGEGKKGKPAGDGGGGKQPPNGKGAEGQQQPSGSPGGSKPAGGEGGQGKADFSAYWAQKFQGLFGNRAEYLDKASRRWEVQEPEALKRLSAAMAEEEARLAAAQEAFLKQAAEQLSRDKPGQEGVSRLAAGVEADLQAAQRLAASPLVQDVALTGVRVRGALAALLLLPLTALQAANAAWQAMFVAQRYEHFLLAEGQRIWAWRNRTENERWFWEIFAWDRLVMPVLVIAAWEYVVPSSLLWSFVVPLVLLSLTSGRRAGPDTLEFWLLAYWGLYKKCWASQVLPALARLGAMLGLGVPAA